MKKYIICDLDGLLIDSESVTLLELQKVFKREGIHLTSEEYQHSIGLAVDDMVEVLEQTHHLSNTKALLLEAFEAARFQDAHMSPPLKPGVRTLLASAARNGIRMAIGTSSEREVAVRFTRILRIAQYFPVIVGGDQVRKRKPHPDIYLSVLQKLNARPEEAVILEDSHHGIMSACNAGVRVINIPDLVPPTAETRARCFATYPSLHEVQKNLFYVLSD